MFKTLTDVLLDEDDGWKDFASCIGADPDIFFSDSGGKDVPERAMKFCGECVVKKNCLDAAMARKDIEDGGIWGGTTIEYRRKIRRKRARAEKLAG